MKEGASNPFADADPERETDAERESDPDAEGSTPTPAKGDTETEPSANEPSSVPDATAAAPAADDGDHPRAPTADSESRPESDPPENADVADPSADRPAGGGVSVSREDLPYVLARDTVKDQRPSVHQLFVREETDRAAKDAERELESALEEDVYRLDAREAIYLAGIQNLDDAAAVLRRWGYDL